MLKRLLTVAWISDFPVEWLPDIPELLRALPRQQPATWQLVLLREFEQDPSLCVHVILLRRRIPHDVTFTRNQTVFHVLKASAWLRLASLFWLDALLIRRVCRRIRPDVVHAWGSERGSGLTGTRLHYPGLVTVQGLYTWFKQVFPIGAYERLLQRLEWRCLSRARLATAESNFAVQFLRQRFPKLAVHQAEHAPHRTFFRTRRQPETEPIHFVTVGRLSFPKGTDLLLQALDRLSPEMPFKLTLISGPDPAYIASLRQSVSAALWQRIEFKHNLLPEEVANVLARSTIMLLPTRADVSPNAVKEAVVGGLPVVASNVGGIPDYVRHDQNGLLFAAGDLEAFTGAIRRARQHPLFGRGQVEPASLTLSHDYLSPERMAANFRTAYDLALKLYKT
jgi:glycosyltransferase involved in cell wall biosynthesis